jgi:heme O synthase-like polyprenyltransferase
VTGRPSLATILLRLGRVSNLPTVSTNVLAGAVLGGGTASVRSLVVVAIAMSAFYVGGMFLNDAFDREIDAVERPERPIPAGHISAGAVFAIGFGLLGVGLGLLALAGSGVGAVGSGVLLGVAIVLYDVWHKKNPLSPILMGLCRVLVYATAALATGGGLSGSVGPGALVLLSYLIGLTYLAKQENLTEVKNVWPLAFLAAPVVYPLVRGAFSPLVLVLVLLVAVWALRAVRLLRERAKGAIPKAVAALIAGISLVDAVLVAAHGGGLALALVAALGLPATLVFHRWVAGT